MCVVSPTILLTRPTRDAEEFAAQLMGRGVGFHVEISPVLHIVPRSKSVDLSGAGGVIFTSRNAVHAVPAHPMPAWCVGPATAEAAARMGWWVRVGGGDVEALYARILADAPDGMLVHLRGAMAVGDLTARLNTVGLKAREEIVYDQAVWPLSDAAKTLLGRENTVIVPLFSPNSAAQFASHGPFEASIHVAAISAATQAALGDMPCARVVVAAKKDANSMCDAVLKLADTV